MLTYLRRIIRFGWRNFWREGGLNVAMVFVLTATITLFAFLFMSHGGVTHLIAQIEDKIDISVYINPDSDQEEISAAKEKLAEMPEVRDISIISEEDALIEFQERHKDDPILLESLEVVGTNPFYASLKIRATEPDQYATILTVLNSSSMEGIIYKVDYVEKKTVIEKLSRFISNINTIGFLLAGVLAVVAVLLAFNTIRVTIYDSSKEISVMRLVGASSHFIRGPFVVQGIIAGTIAALISFVILFLTTYFSGPKMEALTNGFNIFTWFGAHAAGIFFLQLSSGIALGVVSSLIAIRKYLKV